MLFIEQALGACQRAEMGLIFVVFAVLELFYLYIVPSSLGALGFI